jgi:invasion protein IalB
MRILLIAAGLALLGTPAMAQQPQQPQQGQGAKKAARDPNRMVCKTMDIIGSRLGSKRTCMTAAEWSAMEREQRSTTERIQANQPHEN